MRPTAVVGLLVLAGLAGLAACGPRRAPLPPTATSSRPQMVLDSLVNTVEIRPNVVAGFALATAGEALPEGSQLRTSLQSRARLDLGNGSTVRVGPNSLITLERLDLAGETGVRVRFAFGRLWIALRSGRFEAVTPMGIAAVEGSLAEFHYSLGSDPASTDDDLLLIKCLEGTCSFANVVSMGALQQLVVTGGGLIINGPVPMPAAALEEFLVNSPEGRGLLLDRTQAGPSPTSASSATATQALTPSPIPTLLGPAPGLTYQPTATPSTSPTPTDTPIPTPTNTVVRRAPTSPPPTSAPAPADTEPPPPPPPPPPQPTNTQPPRPTNTPVPPPTSTQPPPTNTPVPPTHTAPPPTDTPPPPPTKTDEPTATPTREEPATKTPSPAPLLPTVALTLSVP